MKVEKNIPMVRFKYERFPFPEMDIGDSFLIEGLKERRSVVQAAAQQKIRNKKIFSTRKVDENKWRCWRVA